MNIEKLARRSGKKITCITCNIEEPPSPLYLCKKYNNEMKIISIVCRECFNKTQSNWKDSGWKLEEPEEEE